MHVCGRARGYHTGARARIQGIQNFKAVNFGADVAFVSLNNPDMNGASEAGRGDKQPFVVTGPGEYEVKEVTASGFPSGSKYGGEPRTNTIYSIHLDGLSVLYLGALGDLDLPTEVLEMDEPDVLIVPIGGQGTLNPAEAAKLAVKLEAKIIIPILYDEKALKQFLKEAGAEGTKPVTSSPSSRATWRARKTRSLWSA